MLLDKLYLQLLLGTETEARSVYPSTAPIIVTIHLTEKHGDDVYLHLAGDPPASFQYRAMC